MEGHSGQIAAGFDRVCRQILQNARSELYVNMRYLDIALSAFSFSVQTQIPGIGTDGVTLYVHPKILADLYEENRLLVNRVYLHTVMHCLLRHLFKKPQADPLLWRLSCDMAVESIIDGMYVRSVRMGVSRFRRNWYDLLQKELKVLTAEGIYRVLAKKSLSPFEKASLQQAFCPDDHSLWPAGRQDGPPPPQMQMLADQWQDIDEKTQTQMESFSRDEMEGSGDLSRQMKTELQRKYDYREFLRRFAAWQEEMHVDLDTFDYVFYTYGLSLYGNLPLIEPQEFREVRRIDEFVIVVDVSMSTSGEPVKAFLEQTYAVLTESETYLKKVHIRILQCDDKVREDVKITSREQLDRYMKDFTLKGGGGTDFRPAFAYVERLLEERQMQDLKGMLYFTDGRGIYPKTRPAWETAFIFMDEFDPDIQVPPWAIRMVLPPWELTREKEEPRTLRTDYRFVD